MKKNRVGEVNKNKNGSLMTIIEYNNANNIIVEFENGYKNNSSYRHFLKGNIKCPYDKTIYDIGYLGDGEYKTKDENNKITIQYDYWRSMLRRCYNTKNIDRPTYEDKYVCEDWHNFQNFAKWFDENYYECDGERIELDKDILQKDNRVYSPETCIFVPQRINTLFTKRQNDRGDYPIGVNFHKKTNKFRSRCNIIYNNKCKSIHLGLFNTPEEAFYKYKDFKENYIKEVAEEYKDKIPKKLYDSMYNYKIEIND